MLRSLGHQVEDWSSLLQTWKSDTPVHNAAITERSPPSSQTLLPVPGIPISTTSPHWLSYQFQTQPTAKILHQLHLPVFPRAALDNSVSWFWENIMLIDFLWWSRKFNKLWSQRHLCLRPSSVFGRICFMVNRRLSLIYKMRIIDCKTFCKVLKT